MNGQHKFYAARKTETNFVKFLLSCDFVTNNNIGRHCTNCIFYAICLVKTRNNIGIGSDFKSEFVADLTRKLIAFVNHNNLFIFIVKSVGYFLCHITKKSCFASGRLTCNYYAANTVGENPVQYIPAATHGLSGYANINR